MSPNPLPRTTLRAAVGRGPAVVSAPWAQAVPLAAVTTDAARRRPCREDRRCRHHEPVWHHDPVLIPGRARHAEAEAEGVPRTGIRERRIAENEGELFRPRPSTTPPELHLPAGGTELDRAGMSRC